MSVTPKIYRRACGALLLALILTPAVRAGEPAALATPEEARLQKFWHDHYDALKNYYESTKHIDWVAYYRSHGYQINGGCAACGCGRINYAPVFVTPTTQWAIPQSGLKGPPAITAVSK